MPTAFKVCEWHHTCVPCSIYLLDYYFLRFLYLFHIVFLYETVKRPNGHGLRRQATISADCHGNLCVISRRLNVFLTEQSQVGGRAVWKIPRIQNVLEHEFLHFPDRKWLESYRVSKDMFEQLMRDLHSLQRQVTRLRKPVPVKTVVAMLLKRIGKGLDYREIGDKFGIGSSTACMKVNEAKKLLVSSKMHVISKLQRGIDFQRIINGFQRKWNFPQCLGAIDGTHIP